MFILKPGECSSDPRGLSCGPGELYMVDIQSLMEMCLQVGHQNDLVIKISLNNHLLRAEQKHILKTFKGHLLCFFLFYFNVKYSCCM